MTATKNNPSVVIPPPKARLKSPMSIVEGVKNNRIIKQVTYEEQRDRMLNDEDLKKKTELLRSYLDGDDKIKYNKGKESFLGFISGRLEIRKDDSIQEYSPLMWFDIDGIKNSFSIDSLLLECKNIPEVFAAFPSLSCQGLRIGIWAEANLDSHKTIYKSICEYLESKLTINRSIGEKIDSSTSNPSRLFFECHVNESQYYENLNSSIYKAEQQDKKTLIKKRTISSVELSENEKIDLVQFIVDQQKPIEGRNNYVFNLACKMWEHGIQENSIFQYCLKYEELSTSDPFTRNEIKETVAKATKKATFQKETDQGLLNYKSKVEKNNKPIIAKSLTNNSKTPDAQNSESSIIYNTTKNNAKEFYELHGENKFIRIENFIKDNYILRRNIISHDIECKILSGSTSEYEVFNESDLEIQLLRRDVKGVKEPLSAILGSSIIKDYDPFGNYFKKLPKWNENDIDYISKLSAFVNAKDQEWFDIQFKKMLVRTVACAIKRIPFNKHCFTLVGKQNDGKTSFLRFLCPPKLSEYIKDNPIFSHKDGLLTLVQNLFINLDELANISKYDINQIKKIFTMDKVKERLPYARKPERFARRASFLASTNSGEFLTDTTGNVRWLVFEIDGIYHDNGGKNGYNQNIDIDLVWAQAYSLLNSGFVFRLTKEDILKSELNNKNHQVISIEAEFIQDRYAPATKSTPNSKFITIKDILKLFDNSKHKASQKGMSAAMNLLGFVRCQKYIQEIGQPRRGYYVMELKTEFDPDL